MDKVWETVIIINRILYISVYVNEISTIVLLINLDISRFLKLDLTSVFGTLLAFNHAQNLYEISSSDEIDKNSTFTF